MKKSINIIQEERNYNPFQLIGHGLKLIMGFIAYKIIEGLRKKERDNPVRHFIDESGFKTTTPDGWEDSTDGFNKWSKNIYDQRDNKRAN